MENVKKKSNHGTSTETVFREQWETFFNSVQDHFNRTKFALIFRGQKTGTEQQHISSFHKECLTELESHLKQKEAFNDFLISALETSSLS